MKTARAPLLQHPVRLAEAPCEIAPMMRRKPAGQEIEAAGVERQMLGRRLDRLDIGETPFARRSGNGIEHVARQIRRRDRAGMARHQIGDVAAAGTEIERARRSPLANDRFQGLEVRALGMNGAFDIGLRARPELGLDDFLVGSVHQSAPRARR